MTSVSSYGAQQSLRNAYNDILSGRSEAVTRPPQQEAPHDPAQAFAEELTKRYGGQIAPAQPPLSHYEAHALGLSERETPSGAANAYGATQNLAAAEPDAQETSASQPPESDSYSLDAARARMKELRKNLVLVGFHPDGTPRDIDRAVVKVNGKTVASFSSNGMIVYHNQSATGKLPLPHEIPEPEAGRAQAEALAKELAEKLGGTIEWEKVPTSRLYRDQAELLGLPNLDSYPVKPDVQPG
jgi:hypothetical protein